MNADDSPEVPTKLIVEQVIDIVDIYTFEKNDCIIKFYGATWCKYCNIIKPFVFSHLVSQLYETQAPLMIKKSDYKAQYGQDSKIPFFVILKDGNITSTLQSSNSELVASFFKENLD